MGSRRGYFSRKSSSSWSKKTIPYEKLLYDIIGKDVPKTRDTSLRVPLNVHGRVIHIEILETSENKNLTSDKSTKEKTTNLKTTHFLLNNKF